ncbi:MAG: tRNA pseudouridine(38-40) synthase TruA [Acidobacteria bacterium]|nr:tRNA pseudouridine(38-40) synthase TruA [Acidobacteriota bacterium]
MRNLKITVSYEGTDFCGWQVQPDQRTIQGEIEAALEAVEERPVKVHGSGRTDAGVHALGQVASFHLANRIPCENLQLALNHRLPPAIRVLRVEEVSEGFHARYSATAKTYEYRIWRGQVCPPFIRRYVWRLPYPLDEAAMVAAAPLFEGERDFRSLATGDGAGLESTVRTIYSSRLEREGEQLTYRVRGSGFLYNMVRNIVGTLLEVGRGNLRPADIERILAGRSRALAGPTAPSVGLFLVSVEYPEPC